MDETTENRAIHRDSGFELNHTLISPHLSAPPCGYFSPQQSLRRETRPSLMMSDGGQVAKVARRTELVGGGA